MILQKFRYICHKYHRRKIQKLYIIYQKHSCLNFAHSFFHLSLLSRSHFGKKSVHGDFKQLWVRCPCPEPRVRCPRPPLPEAAVRRIRRGRGTKSWSTPRPTSAQASTTEIITRHKLLVTRLVNFRLFKKQHFQQIKSQILSKFLFFYFF